MKYKHSIGFILVILMILSACSAAGGAAEYENQMNHDFHQNGENKDTAFKVVIDPGHGGKDVGAPGASGQFEKNFNLIVSQKVSNLLEQEPEIQIYNTRTDDRYISQKSRYRPQYANEQHADVFISIHGNTYSDPNVTGTETYYYHKNSQQLAQIMQKHVMEATGFRDRGIKKKDFFVIKDTKMPAALIEVGYLSNPTDESLMWTEDFQDRVAASIVEGIKEFQARSI